MQSDHVEITVVEHRVPDGRREFLSEHLSSYSTKEFVHQHYQCSLSLFSLCCCPRFIPDFVSWQCVPLLCCRYKEIAGSLENAISDGLDAAPG